jgi:uncharacterized protein
MYQHPGVYIEHVISNALSIEAASTSVTAIIGPTKRGARITDTAGTPTFVTSMAQYATLFGPLGSPAGGLRDEKQNPDAMGHAARLYFANGGTKAYILPVASSDGTAASLTLDLMSGTDRRRLVLTAASGGAWANDLMARVDADSLAGEFKLTLGTRRADVPLPVNAVDWKFDTVLETFAGLSVSSANANFFDNRINATSTLVKAAMTTLGPAAGTPVAAPLVGMATGGVDPAAAASADYDKAFNKLKDYRDVSILLLPGLVYAGADKAIYDSALTHAEFMQNRLVILDPGSTVLTSPADVAAAGFTTSSYAVLYYPNVTVSNPFYDADKNPTVPKTFAVGPAAIAAGMWARIDGTRGVWKTPAGLEATVRGVLGPTIRIGNEAQDNLNEFGVNCLRAIIGPTVIWGGRTLATKARPQFRYVAVRRTQSMIGESLYRALQAVVFEPNDHKLWGALRASVGDFMDGLHRSGAFQGEKSSDAFFVRCGLGATMTQGDIDAGIVRVVVGFAPLKPAEFVVVEIQQKVGQAA